VRFAYNTLMARHGIDCVRIRGLSVVGARDATSAASGGLFFKPRHEGRHGGATMIECIAQLEVFAE
jgi:hypothetical protein